MQTASTFHAAILTLTVVAAVSAAPPVGWCNDGTGKFPAATPSIN